MVLDSKDILFASLLGAEKVDQIQRFSALQNVLSKHVLPPIPFLPLRNESFVYDKPFEGYSDTWQADYPINEEEQFFPLSFSFTETGEKWLFPYEPMINISGGSNIIKRNVAKQDNQMIGTVKERWSIKDYEITITGALFGNLLKGKPEDCFPKQHMQELLEFIKTAKEIFVYCYPLELLGIAKIVIEDYSFPFTKGENAQAYEIKAVSDFGYNLLIEE